MTQRILIIGAGNVGSAICKGLIHSDNSFSIELFDLSSDKMKVFASEPKVTLLDQLTKDTVSKNNMIVLAVKPHDLSKVSKQLSPLIQKDQVILSVLAGKTITDIRQSMDFEGRVIRAMPNIAALIGESATGISCSEKCDEKTLLAAKSVFDCIGSTVVVDEKHLDAVTGLSGSGPAYVFLFLESMIDGGLKMGLTRAIATQLALQTLAGSAALALKTQDHPAILRDRVTTPGGTTIDALHALENKGFRSMVMEAVEVATLKSKKLSQK